MRIASGEELTRILPFLEGLGCGDSAALLSEIGDGRVSVVLSDDKLPAVAVVGPWRAHLSLAWIKAFYGGRKPSSFARDLSVYFLGIGYEGVLSPLADGVEASRFKQAGYTELERILVMESTGLSPIPCDGPAEIRVFEEADIESALEIDEGCFDSFWRFGRTEILDVLSDGRAFAAVLNGQLVGYNILSVDAGRGVLARLAVAPSTRRRGIGRQLVSKAIDCFSEQSVLSVVLSTQRGNEPARSLYAGLGFRNAAEKRLLICSR